MEEEQHDGGEAAVEACPQEGRSLELGVRRLAVAGVTSRVIQHRLRAYYIIQTYIQMYLHTVYSLFCLVSPHTFILFLYSNLWHFN